METLAYFLKGLSRETNLFKNYFCTFHLKTQEKKWTKTIQSERVICFNDVLLPNIYTQIKYANIIPGVFEESFFIFLYFNDDYNPKNFHCVEKILQESPYCYTDAQCNVVVQENDVVIDAGAWIGDFSAYAAYKKAIVYAFEPGNSSYELLEKTALLHNRIIPVKSGLSNNTSTAYMKNNRDDGIANTVIGESDITNEHEVEEIQLTTIDDFVKENNLQKVDFIKADIEGFERYMLLGAKETLKKFAPKLVICTYHLPDDKEVLRNIIVEANPDYTIIQKKGKLFAQVIKDE